MILIGPLRPTSEDVPDEATHPRLDHPLLAAKPLQRPLEWMLSREVFTNSHVGTEQVPSQPQGEPDRLSRRPLEMLVHANRRENGELTFLRFHDHVETVHRCGSIRELALEAIGDMHEKSDQQLENGLTREALGVLVEVNEPNQVAEPVRHVE